MTSIDTAPTKHESAGTAKSFLADGINSRIQELQSRPDSESQRLATGLTSVIDAMNRYPSIGRILTGHYMTQYSAAQSMQTEGSIADRMTMASKGSSSAVGSELNLRLGRSGGDPSQLFEYTQITIPSTELMASFQQEMTSMGLGSPVQVVENGSHVGPVYETIDGSDLSTSGSDIVMPARMTHELRLAFIAGKENNSF